MVSSSVRVSWNVLDVTFLIDNGDLNVLLIGLNEMLTLRRTSDIMTQMASVLLMRTKGETSVSQLNPQAE